MVKNDAVCQAVFGVAFNAVDLAAYRAVGGTAYDAVDRAVNRAVHDAVWRAVASPVGDAVYGAGHGDPPHPSLQDSLAEGEDLRCIETKP